MPLAAMIVVSALAALPALLAVGVLVGRVIAAGAAAEPAPQGLPAASRRR